MNTNSFYTLSDFENYAQRKMTKSTFAFYSGGADGEDTVSENARSFQRYQIIPRVLRDVSKLETQTSILGHSISFPVCIGPSAIHSMAHSDAEVGTARGAKAMKVGFTLSNHSSRSIDEIAEQSADSLKFLQVQFFNLRDITLSLVRSAERCGFQAIVLTVDMPALGRRINFHRLESQYLSAKDVSAILTFPNLKFPAQPSPSNNFYFDPSATWKDVKWLISQTKLPVIVKGILNADDAALAVEAGASGILVSNHGGRQLDCVPATIDVLSDVVKAVNGRCEVYMDGGVRCGTDIVKALALGARVVFLGRPAIYALNAGGEQGVEKMLQILKDEFSSAMALCGCATVDDIKSTVVVRHNSKL